MSTKMNGILRKIRWKNLVCATRLWYVFPHGRILAMKKRTSTVAGLLVLAVWMLCVPGAAAQESQVRTVFDHILYLTIESDPPGATVYALADGGKRVGEVIGVTPCQTMVGLKWDRTAGFKRWKRLNIWAPGDVCYALMDTEKTWDLFASCSAVLPDCKPKIVNERILSLPSPGLDWEEAENWPSHLTLKLNLTQVVRELEPESRASANPAPSSVIMASGSAEDPSTVGTINITASTDGAAVYVNSKLAGRAPLSVKLPAGAYAIAVYKDGWSPFTANVKVKSSSSMGLHAEMKPRSPAP